MKVYMCDIAGCETIIKDKKDLYYIELRGADSETKMHLCKDCYEKITDFMYKCKLHKEDKEQLEAIEKLWKDMEIEEKELTEQVDEKQEVVIEDTEQIDEKQEEIADKTIIEEKTAAVKEELVKKSKQHKKTIAENIEEIGGIDVLMTAICKKEKSIPEFEAQFGLSKNSLRTYLSMNKITIKGYADAHGIDMSRKSVVGVEVHSKIKEVGIENILESLASNEKSMERVAQELGITKSQLSSYFHNNYISVRDYKKQKKDKEKAKKIEVILKSDAETREEIKKIHDKSSMNMGMRTVATGEMKKHEKQIDIVSGSCFKCAYRDLDSNTCGYTILTGRSRHGGKGKCCHFVDVDKL